MSADEPLAPPASVATPPEKQEQESPANHANGTPSAEHSREASKLPDLSVAYLAGAKDERGHFFAFHCGRSDDDIEAASRRYVELSGPASLGAATPPEPEARRCKWCNGVAKEIERPAGYMLPGKVWACQNTNCTEFGAATPIYGTVASPASREYPTPERIKELWAKSLAEPDEPPSSGEAEAQERAINDLRFYAKRLCVDKPERYEVRQTWEGVETKLSDSCQIVLSALTLARQRADAAAEDALQGLIGFIGSGENSRGRFPTTLSELSADCTEYAALRASDPRA